MEKTLVDRMKNDLLDKNHQLYEILKGKDTPTWWKDLKLDNEIYIEVRKGNIIDAYYLGGRMAELKLDRYNKIVATAHPRYNLQESVDLEENYQE